LDSGEPPAQLTASLFSQQQINKEEELLEKEKSTFPILQTLMTNKVPYEQLWTTAYEFSTKSEEWMNGTWHSHSAGTEWAWVGGIHPAGSEIKFAPQILTGLFIRF
jgi:hypothetical protein